MKYKLTIIAFVLSLTAYSQKKWDQYSFEADYGYNVGTNPTAMDLGHWQVSFRYMMERDWGIKFDFAKDAFRESSTVPETGSDYTRVSIQVVNNLGRTLGSETMQGDKMGMLGHAGLGYSSLTSTTLPGTDNILHVMVGITPQYKLTDWLAAYVDISYILNFTQHFQYDGLYPNDGVGAKRSFTGNMINASVGLSYYFGSGKSRADWNGYTDTSGRDEK